MDEFLLIVILIAIVFVLLPIIVFSRISDVKHSLDRVNDKLKRVLDELEELKHKAPTVTKATEEKPVVVQKEVTPPVITEIKPVEPVIVPPPVPEPVKEIIKEEPVPVKKEPISTESFVPVKPGMYEEVDERKFAEEPKEQWFKKNSDWEKFIGENLINKIGIAVLVLGISFFVKYAIDKEWINETGRVVIGLVCGGILIGLAHYIRNSYRSFSSVLVGGGLSVFYFTIAFAFHQYHLISQQVAFIIMVIISAFAVVLSLYYKRQELAILATIGGFITPFLVSTGQNNYVALFTYLAILNTSLMVLAWFKRWVAINIISLVFTIIIYGGWLLDSTVIDFKSPFPYFNAFLFATIFYIQFVIMNIINSLRMKRKFTAFDFIILLSTNFLYYGAGMAALANSGLRYSDGIFSASLGLFNLALAVVFFRKKNVDKNFVGLLIALVVTFISLAGPVQFSGNPLVLFWAGEMVILYWLYQRSGIKQLKFFSLLLSACVLVSLLLTWSEVYLSGTQTIIPIIINKGFITTWVTAIALFIYYILVRKETEENYISTVSNKGVKTALLVGAIVISYAAGVLEIFYQFTSRSQYGDIQLAYQQAYMFAVAILLLKLFRHSPSHAIMKFVFTAFCVGFYITNIGDNYFISRWWVTQENGAWFSAHWVAAALLFWLLYDLIRYFFKVKDSKWESYKPAFTWIASASMIVLLSTEMRHVILWVFMDMKEMDWWDNLYFKPALTILWSICSFVMIWLGMKYSFRTLRLISLTLFSITLVKLFSYDIVNIPPGGKIAAFILLGVLLLTVSFMYQRLKKIIIDNNSSE
jgi:uncharacterized membrane protein